MSDLENDSRARPVPPWVWLVVAVLVAAIAWWMIAPDGDLQGGTVSPDRVAGERQTTPVIGGEYYDDPQTRETLPVSSLRANPGEFANRTVEGSAVVEEVTNGGFWAIAKGERIFVLLDPAMQASPPDLQSGQHVRLSGSARVPSSTGDEGMEGISIELRERVTAEPVVLHANDLTVVDTPAGGGNPSGAAGE